MGCCQNAETKRNIVIDEELKADKERNYQIKKLLFMGVEGAGKSTFIKQLSLIYGHGYNDEDRIKFKEQIKSFIVDEMRLCLDSIDIYIREEKKNEEILLSDEAEMASNIIYFANIDHNLLIYGYLHETNNIDKPQEIIKLIYQYENNVNNQPFIPFIPFIPTTDKTVNYKLTKQIIEAVELLKNHHIIKIIYDERNLFGINESCYYFWSQMQRISNDDYIPNDTDLLLIQNEKTDNEKFEIHRYIFHVFSIPQSVGSKFYSMFETVNAIFFVASLCCYNETVTSIDGIQENKMVSSLLLFEKIVNNIWFNKVQIILFFNKSDLFIEKIQKIPIISCPAFEHFDGNDCFEETISFIRTVFHEYNMNPKKQIYTHITCAVDKDNVERVFNDVQHSTGPATLSRNGLV